MVLTIPPKTTGLLRIAVVNAAGAVVTDAAAVADVYGPTGKRVADNATLTNAGQGNYDLEVLPTWSTAESGAVIEGEYRAVITVTQGALTATERVKYTIMF